MTPNCPSRLSARAASTADGLTPHSSRIGWFYNSWCLISLYTHSKSSNLFLSRILLYGFGFSIEEESFQGDQLHHQGTVSHSTIPKNRAANGWAERDGIQELNIFYCSVSVSTDQTLAVFVLIWINNFSFFSFLRIFREQRMSSQEIGICSSRPSSPRQFLPVSARLNSCGSCSAAKLLLYSRRDRTFPSGESEIWLVLPREQSLWLPHSHRWPASPSFGAQ